MLKLNSLRGKLRWIARLYHTGASAQPQGSARIRHFVRLEFTSWECFAGWL